MYDNTVTLFNRKKGERGQGDTWYPSVLRNVHLIMDKAAILSKYGAEAADNAVLNVRYQVDGEKKMVGEKPWLPQKAWQKDDDPAKSLTFTGGEAFDFFWLGEWTGGVVSDADYSTDLSFYDYMNRMYDHVFAVSSVGGPYSVIPHFEIMGK